MARKVFISFLGTGNYVQTHYTINGECSKPVRFIQEAILDNIGHTFTGDDKIIIFFTETSRKVNWEDNGQSKINEECEKIGLKSTLQSKPYWKYVDTAVIEEGFSEEEIWRIFEVVYEKLQEGDEIYFDVTHAFRSIPMFSTVLFSYSSFMKGTTLKQVLYGAFEKLGPAYKVREMPLKNREAPVIDLSSIIQLQELTQVASKFSEYGKIGEIGAAFSNIGNKKLTMVVANLSKNSNNLEDYIITNREQQIREGKFVSEIQNNINSALKDKNVTVPQKELLLALRKKVSTFKQDGGIDNVIAAINWATQYDLIQQAYTMSEELIISICAQKYIEKSIYSEETKWRNFISGIMAIKDSDIENSNFKGELADDPELSKFMLNIEEICAIRKHYSVLAGNRNILSHAKKSTLSLKQFKEQLRTNFDKCLEILLPEYVLNK